MLRASGWVDASWAGCPHYRMCQQPPFLVAQFSPHHNSAPPLALLAALFVQQRGSASPAKHARMTRAALVLEAAAVCSTPRLWLNRPPRGIPQTLNRQRCMRAVRTAAYCRVCCMVASSCPLLFITAQMKPAGAQSSRAGTVATAVLCLRLSIYLFCMHTHLTCLCFLVGVMPQRRLSGVLLWQRAGQLIC
jgi:hypothetical protein